MKMPDVYLIGELRMKNFEIFRLMETKQDRLNYVKGFIVIEDCNRKAKLEDYPFLIDVYKHRPSEFEGGQNIIKITALLAEKCNVHEEKIIEHITTSLVEFKENVDVRFSVDLKSNLEVLLDKIDESPFEVYSELLECTEAKPNISLYPKEILQRLFQELNSK